MSLYNSACPGFSGSTGIDMLTFPDSPTAIELLFGSTSAERSTISQELIFSSSSNASVVAASQQTQQQLGLSHIQMIMEAPDPDSTHTSYSEFGSESDSIGSSEKSIGCASTRAHELYSNKSCSISPPGRDPASTQQYGSDNRNIDSYPRKVQVITVQYTEKEKRERKYECKYCKKRFTRPSSLTSHVYTHTGEKPFACDYPKCNKRFSVLSNLRRHYKVHTNRRIQRSNGYFNRSVIPGALHPPVGITGIPSMRMPGILTMQPSSDNSVQPANNQSGNQSEPVYFNGAARNSFMPPLIPIKNTQNGLTNQREFDPSIGLRIDSHVSQNKYRSESFASQSSYDHNTSAIHLHNHSQPPENIVPWSENAGSVQNTSNNAFISNQSVEMRPTAAQSSESNIASCGVSDLDLYHQNHFANRLLRKQPQDLDGMPPLFQAESKLNSIPPINLGSVLNDFLSNTSASTMNDIGIPADCSLSGTESIPLNLLLGLGGNAQTTRSNLLSDSDSRQYQNSSSTENLINMAHSNFVTDPRG